MTHNIKIFGAVLAAVLAGAGSAQERTYTLLDREVEYLMAIWPGTYDNVEQVSFDTIANNDGAHDRLHVRVQTIPASELGDHNLLTRMFDPLDSAKPPQVSVYALQADESENAIRVRRYTTAEELPTDINTPISPDTLNYLDGCDLLIRRDNDWLVGGSNTQTCGAGTHDQNAELRISANTYWLRERPPVQNVDGSGEAGWHQLDRARWFACMIDFPREPGGRPVVTHHYIKIHDQGGRFSFLHPDGQQRLLTMRNTWSFGMQRNSFVIAVQIGDDNGETDVYAWAEPGADRIGMNPGHLRVQCDLDTPTHVKMQHWLRPDS